MQSPPGPHRRPPLFGSSSSRRPRGGGSASSLPAYIWVPVLGVTGTIGICYYTFSDEVPLTKRRRWIATSAKFERQLGDQEYKQLLQRYRADILPPNHRANRTVQRVGTRIAQASTEFAKEYNLSALSHSPYTYTVVRSDQANAFVLPNNHVFVLTGLFKYVRDEDELAAVLGHEMAHNLARHAGEKMSGNLVIQILARALLLVDPSGVLSTLFLPAASLLNDLPHSRQAELEADRIGLSLGSHACYDPRAAKRVFQRMQQDLGDKAPPEFLSTHPGHESRIAEMDQWMPEAMKTFEGDYGEKCRHVRSGMARARELAALPHDDAARIGDDDDGRRGAYRGS